VRECFLEVGSWTWGGRPIFTARNMKLALGLAAVTCISFYVFEDLLRP
jgi:hypothetical protein